MENVSAILVNVDALNTFCINVTRNIRTLVHYQKQIFHEPSPHGQKSPRKDQDLLLNNRTYI